MIQHLDVEGPAQIGRALTAAGVELDIVRTDLGDPVPEDVGGLDALVVMGGPMSATSDEGFPTRRSELALLQRAIRAGTPVLGVCLGAQLLAAAAGGEVRSGHGVEVGWGDVELLPAAGSDPLFAGVEDCIEVLHWHGDTYSLPAGAVCLARSRAYDQQAFRVGPRAWGLQFHLEVDTGEVDRFVEAFPEDAASAAGGASAIRERSVAAVGRLGPARDAMLARFAALAAGRPGAG